MDGIFPEKTGFLWLNNTMGMLWEQHAAWTRMTIISIVEGLADVEPTTRRLLRNPGTLPPCSEGFTASKPQTGSKPCLPSIWYWRRSLYRQPRPGTLKRRRKRREDGTPTETGNSAFLSRINPFWNRQEMERLWRVHLDQVRDQALTRLNGDYDEDIFFYDHGEKHVLKMADEFTRGIARQFRISS